ncbi:unnamed protein product, partial [marine sediment metagenome]
LGFSAAGAGRLYVWAIDNSGTVELALSRTADLFPESALISTTAEGAAGAADSASVMYSTTARSSIPTRLLGYVEITTGATEGEWDNAPTAIQLMGAGVKRTGEIVQVQYTQTGAVNTGVTAIPSDDSIPENDEGDEYMTLAIVPSSNINKLLIEAKAMLAHSSASTFITAALFQDSTVNSLAATGEHIPAVVNNGLMLSLRHEMITGTSGSTTFKIRAGGAAGATTTFNGANAGRLLGGVMASSIRITEIMQ